MSSDEGEIEIDIQQMQIKYATLVTDTRVSLKERNISPAEVVTHVMSFQVFPAVLKDNEKVLGKEHELLSKANNFEDIFKVLAQYWSFMDYLLLGDIISKFGSDNDKKNLDQYEEILKRFLNSYRVETSETISGRNDSCQVLHFKLNTRSLSQYSGIKLAIARIFKVEIRCVRLHKIEPGCLQLTFLLPKTKAFPEEKVFEQEFPDTIPRVLQIELEQDDGCSQVLYQSNLMVRLKYTALL